MSAPPTVSLHLHVQVRVRHLRPGNCSTKQLIDRALPSVGDPPHTAALVAFLGGGSVEDTTTQSGPLRVCVMMGYVCVRDDKRRWGCAAAMQLA